MLDSFVKAIGGPLLVKLALAVVLFAAFLFLRRRDSEGMMAGFALLAGILALRDLAFAFFPSASFFRASDLVIFGLVLYLVTKPFRPGWTLWGSLVLECVALVILFLDVGLGLFPDLPRWVFSLAALAPVAANGVVTALRSAESEGPLAELGAKTWLPLLVGSLVYIGASIFLGPSDGFFQSIVVPLFYGLLFSLGFFYVDIIQGQLIRAVDYYEESIDSLYDMLLGTGSAMKADFSLQEVLDNMLLATVNRTGADSGLLLLTDEFDEAVSVRSMRGFCVSPVKLPENLPRQEEPIAEFLRHARFALGEGILGEVARTGRHFFAASGEDPRLPTNGEEDWLRPGGVIAVPLIVHDSIIGVICVAAAPGVGFTERDFDRCKMLASFGSIAVSSSFTFLEAAERSDIEREAAIAENVQRTMQPKRLPALRGLSFGAFSSPARGVCSDYYDVIQTRPDKAVLVVGDVAGKGVAASMVMVMLRSILHLITNTTKDAATLLQWLNRGVSGMTDMDHYATVALVGADASTGSIEIANAGNQPVLIYRSHADAIETIEMKSVPIGVDRTTVYSARRMALGAGDVLVMCTDGIVEAINGQGRQFGRKNLANILQNNHALPAKDIAESVRDELRAFTGQTRQHDDQTVLVMKAKG